MVCVAVSGVLFMLWFTRWFKKISPKLRVILITVPAIVIAIMIFLGFDAYTIIPSSKWNWVVNPDHTLITTIIYVWFAVMGLAILFIPLVFYFKGKGDKLHRKLSLLLALGFCVPLIIGSIGEAVFPLVFSIDSVPLTNPMMTVFSITAFFVIRKYRLFDYSPKHQWESIIQSMSEGLLITNNKDEIMYANNAFCKLIEYAFEEIQGKIAREVILDKSEKNLMEFVNKRSNKDVSSHYEIQLKTKTGKKVWVMISSAPYLNEKGNVIGSISIQTNIHQLREKQSRLNHAIEAGRMVTVDSDFISKTVSLSENVQEILGIKTHSGNIDELFQFVHPEDREMLSKIFQKSLVDRSNPDVEFRVLRPDTNEIVWIERRIEWILDNQGAIIGSTGLLVDITRKKQIETERQILIKELEDYKHALDASSIVSITSQQGKIIYVNDNFCNISKYSRQELIGQDHKIINSGYHSKDLFRSMWLTISCGRIWRGEIRNKAKDGSIYWVDTTIVPFMNGSKTPHQYIAIRTDITNRKQFEEKLEKANKGLEASERKHKEAQAIANFGNWELDFTSGKATWSEEACRIYGLDLSDNIHSYNTWLEFIHPLDRSRVIEVSEQAQASLSQASFPHRIVWRNGTIRHVHSISQFKLNEEGVPLGMYGVVHDITEQKKAEESLKAANNELQTFMYRASHDLRGPLASIIGLTHVSKIDVTDPKALTYLKMIGSSTDKLDKILKGLVQTMLIKDTKQFSDKVIFHDLITETLAKFEHYNGYDKMNVVVETTRHEYVHSNKQILESVFQNLIENAIKFRNETQPNCRLKIKAEDNGKTITLVFEDNGIGIPDFVQEKVFDMYFRATNEATGSGLGLYLVKTGIEKLGGKISLQSIERIGTKFFIELPK